MTCFDEIAEDNGDREYRAWLRTILDSKDDVVAFVAGRLRQNTTGEIFRFVKGSFNLGICIRFSNDGPEVVIRFPKPGHTATAFRDEKVANEVSFIRYFGHKTTIPLPRLISWGLTADSPRGLGPFIIMEYVHGTSLSTILRKPIDREDEDVVLNPNIDNAILDKVYNQIADYMLQLSKLDLQGIGAITDASGIWSVTGRPLTYNMNELATVARYPVSEFPITQFATASEYFYNLGHQHMIHLRTQRNLADDSDDAQRRYIARHRFMQLVPQYCLEDGGPFIPFCDDLQPSNILVDPETLDVKAVLDLEYTNSMPAQFAYDPPWWLLLMGPDIWIERRNIDDFVSCYEPRLEQFLRALERIEAESGSSEPRLSVRMRDSWRNKRFWFDYGIRKSFDVDAIYWGGLDDGSAGVETLSSEAREEMEAITRVKMEQLREYKEECASRFSGV